MQIIELNLSHLNVIHELLVQQFKNESWTKEQIKSSLISNCTKFFGLVNESGQIITLASVLITPDDVNLLHIATREEYKRKGYARALLEYLIRQKQPNQTFSLEVKSQNKTAINLYESLGFKTLSVRKNYYKDGDNALCMFLNN